MAPPEEQYAPNALQGELPDVVGPNHFEGEDEEAGQMNQTPDDDETELKKKIALYYHQMVSHLSCDFNFY